MSPVPDFNPAEDEVYETGSGSYATPDGPTENGIGNPDGRVMQRGERVMNPAEDEELVALARAIHAARHPDVSWENAAGTWNRDPRMFPHELSYQEQALRSAERWLNPTDGFQPFGPPGVEVETVVRHFYEKGREEALLDRPTRTDAKGQPEPMQKGEPPRETVPVEEER